MTSINYNAAATNTILYINQNTTQQNTELAQLSSGLRTVNASVDPAASAIGTQLNSDADVLTQAASNASNMQSVLQTADGALSNVADILTQMKSLAGEALSGTADTASLTDINTEYTQLLSELNDIASSTSFNGTNLIDGSFSASVLVGTTSSDTISVDLTGIDASTSGLSLSGTDLSSTSDATTALASLTTAIDTISSDRATVGAYESQFNYSESVINTAQQNTAAAASTITSDDTSTTEDQFNSTQVLTEAGIAALTKAETIPQDILRLLQS